MSAAPYDLVAECNKLEKKVKTLLNADLKGILQDEGLTKSGNKAALQDRIIDLIRNAVTAEDYHRFQGIHMVVHKYGSGGSGHSLPLPSNPTTAFSHTASSNPTYGQGYPPQNGPYHQRPVHNYASPYSTPTFKKSPFYEQLKPLTVPTSLPVMAANRNTVTSFLSLTPEQAAQLAADTSLRVMVYCALEQDASPKDISFPVQLELKCNNEVFSGNLRGVKKKPGTTKPADVTPFIQKRAAMKNQVSLSYASTERKFQFVVYLVRRTSVEQLVDKVKRGQIITREQVLREMISKAQDPDIVATSTVMSLKCVLSGMRMQVPCRSTICNHNQCYDADSFLQLQEQAPQWSCPVCQKVFRFDSLVVDEYVKDILNKTTSEIEQVTIEPEGQWRPGVHTNNEFKAPSARPSATPNTKRNVSDVFDLDGGVEIVGSNAGGSSTTSNNVSTPSTFPTPSFTSRDSSTAAPNTSRAGSKRPAEAIDLTLSSDEDADPPIRKVKRQYTSASISTVPTIHQKWAASSSVQPPRTTPTPVGGTSLGSWVGNQAGSQSPQWTGRQGSVPNGTSIQMPNQQQQQYRQAPQISPVYDTSQYQNWSYRG